MQILGILGVFLIAVLVAGVKLNTLLSEDFPRMEKHLASVPREIPTRFIAPVAVAAAPIVPLAEPGMAAVEPVVGAAAVAGDEAVPLPITPTPPASGDATGYHFGGDPELPSAPEDGGAVIGNAVGSAVATSGNSGQVAADGQQYKGDDWTKAFEKSGEAEKGKKKKKDKDGSSGNGSTDTWSGSSGTGGESDIWSGLYKKLEEEAKPEKSADSSPSQNDDSGTSFDSGDDYYDGDYDDSDY